MPLVEEMLCLEKFKEFSDYKTIKLSPLNIRILKLIDYYDYYTALMELNEKDEQMDFILYLLLKREEIVKNILKILSYRISLQNSRVAKSKNYLYHYLTQYSLIKKLQQQITVLRAVDNILFLQKPISYITNLKYNIQPKIVYLNIVIEGRLFNSLWKIGDMYYHISYHYKPEDVESVEQTFINYYEVLQLLSGELCLGYWTSPKKIFYLNINREYIEKYLPNTKMGKWVDGLSYRLFHRVKKVKEAIKDYCKLCEFKIINERVSFEKIYYFNEIMDEFSTLFSDEIISE